MPDLRTTTPEFLTVRELAELLRIKERKVYDLAASGEVPCSRATGKLLFPSAEIRTWIESAQSGGAREQVARPPIVLGSHDPLLDWAIRQSMCGLATFFDGSRDGLDRFARGEGVAAGLHIHDDASDSWNAPAAEAAAADCNAVLVTFASRQRGIVYRRGDARPEGLAGLRGLRIVPRQEGSGTATLFARLARDSGLDLGQVDLTDVARTEDDAVEAVRRGEADATFGLNAVARAYGLEFEPVIEERFALLVDRKAWFEPAFQTLLAFCRTQKFHDRAEACGGYDVSNLGRVIWNA